MAERHPIYAEATFTIDSATTARPRKWLPESWRVSRIISPVHPDAGRPRLTL